MSTKPTFDPNTLGDGPARKFYEAVKDQPTDVKLEAGLHVALMLAERAEHPLRGDIVAAVLKLLRRHVEVMTIKTIIEHGVDLLKECEEAGEEASLPHFLVGGVATHEIGQKEVRKATEQLQNLLELFAHNTTKKEASNAPSK